MTKPTTPLLLKKLPGAAVVTRQKQRPSSQGPPPISALHSTTINGSNNPLAHTTSQQPPSFQTDLRSPDLLRYFSVSPSAPARNTMADTADELAARFEEQASMQQQQQQQQKQPSAPKGNNKKNKSSGGGGGSGAADPQKKQKDISRALSRLLRHQATNAGIQLDREGYAPLDKVVSLLFFLISTSMSGLYA